MASEWMLKHGHSNTVLNVARLDHKKECAILGCHNPPTKHDRFCKEHGGKEGYKRREDSAELNKGYGTAAWKRLRKLCLSRHPLCQACLSRNVITPAEHIDHVLPRRHGQYLTPSVDELQSLCQPCHSWKTQKEKHGLIYDWRTGTLIIHKIETLKALTNSPSAFRIG